MDADHPSAVSSPTVTCAVTCARCNQMLLVLVSEAQPPCFREPNEQAKCPELAERIARGEQIFDLSVCDPLRRSIEARSGPREVDAIVHDGIWYVVRRAPGEPSPLYSPVQARTQAELARGRGQPKLADQFLWAADKAESLQFDPGAQGRLPGGAIVLVIVLATAALAAWYFLLQPSGHVDAERAQLASTSKLAAVKPAAPPPMLAPPPPALAPAPAISAVPPIAAVPSPSSSPSSSQSPTSSSSQSSSPSPNASLSPAPAPAATPAPAHTAAAAVAPTAVPPHQPPSRPSAQAMPATPPRPAEPEQTASVASAGSPPAAAVAEPEMVALPGGSFAMGSNDDYSERPIHSVTVTAFAIGKFPVTVREWNACVDAKSCPPVASGRDDAPVANLSWSDAQQFVSWLARATGKNYRLPSEAEWEYAARGGTSTPFWWGRDVEPGMVNCRGCNEPYDSKHPMAVGSLKPNPFGLFDMGGAVGQWVADCWHKDYRGAPTDGSAWIEEGGCPSRVFRSGSWRNKPVDVRTASRAQFDFNARYPTLGVRVARSP